MPGLQFNSKITSLPFLFQFHYWPASSRHPVQIAFCSFRAYHRSFQPWARQKGQSILVPHSTISKTSSLISISYPREQFRAPANTYNRAQQKCLNAFELDKLVGFPLFHWPNHRPAVDHISLWFAAGCTYILKWDPVGRIVWIPGHLSWGVDLCKWRNTSSLDSAALGPGSGRNG